MILRPLVKITVRGKILTIGDKEFPIEIRSEYVSEDHEQPDRQRCFGPDGLQTDSFIKMLGRLTGLKNPSILLSCGPKPNVPPGYLITATYEYTLHSCDYYFRDLVQEKQERENPDCRHYTKLPLEYVTNLFDLTDKERDLIFRSLRHQMGGENGEVADPPPPPEPTAEELSNIDQLPPPELETLINKIEAHQQWDKLKQTAYEKAAWWSCNLKQANQSQRCTHIKPDGSTCGSPAITDKTFCYWHEQAHLHRTPSGGLLLDGAEGNQLVANGNELTRSRTGEQPQSAAFEMPILEDRLGVQLGIMRVCDLLAGKSIDPYTARVMLYGLRLAQRTLGDQDSLNGEHQ